MHRTLRLILLIQFFLQQLFQPFFFFLKIKRLRRTVNTVMYYLDCYPSASAGRETAWVINQRQSNSGSVGLGRLPTDGPLSVISTPLKPGKKWWWLRVAIAVLAPGCELYEKLRWHSWLSPWGTSMRRF